MRSAPWERHLLRPERTIPRRSRCVAQITLTSTFSGLSAPRGKTSRSERTRSKRHWRVRTNDGALWYLQLRAPDQAHRRSHDWSKPAANHLEKFADRDPELKRTVQRVSRLIHLDPPLVLHGESGCGKERIPREPQPVVAQSACNHKTIPRVPKSRTSRS